MCVVIKSRPEFKMGHVGSKTRSLGQFLEKPCVLSRRHSFDLVFMKLCQNDFLTLNKHFSRRAMQSDDSSCFSSFFFFFLGGGGSGMSREWGGEGYGVHLFYSPI